MIYEALFLAAINAGLPGLIGAPTYPMLRDATQRSMTEVLDIEGIPYEFHKSENTITLPTAPFRNSQIFFRAVDNFERLRGTNLAWFGVDELTYCKPEAWSRLQGRMRHPQAKRRCGFAAWTPKGYDWVYELFIEKPGRDFRAVLASPRENRYVADTGVYEALQDSYDERLYRQEVLGEYLSLISGSAYFSFSRAENIRPVGYRQGPPLLWSLDFNITPMSSVIAQIEDDLYYGRQAAKLSVIDEISLTESNVWRACEEFERKTLEWARRAGVLQVRIYGDASGRNRTHTGPACYQMIREFFSTRPQYQVSFHNKTANPAVRDRVNATNALLCNAREQRRCFIDPKCRQLQRDLERAVWEVDSNGNMTGVISQANGLSHISDALGYLIETEFGLHQHGGPRTAYVA